jgi:hypothetical protein
MYPSRTCRLLGSQILASEAHLVVEACGEHFTLDFYLPIAEC